MSSNRVKFNFALSCDPVYLTEQENDIIYVHNGLIRLIFEQIFLIERTFINNPAKYF